MGVGSVRLEAGRLQGTLRQGALLAGAHAHEPLHLFVLLDEPVENVGSAYLINRILKLALHQPFGHARDEARLGAVVHVDVEPVVAKHLHHLLARLGLLQVRARPYAGQRVQPAVALVALPVGLTDQRRLVRHACNLDAPRLFVVAGLHLLQPLHEARRREARVLQIAHEVSDEGVMVFVFQSQQREASKLFHLFGL